jgi:hypothetical protein
LRECANRATFRAASRPLAYGHPMSSFVDFLVPLAVLAVAIVLVLGLVNMLRGGNANTSQRLMRVRVLLQFVAIIIIMGVVWWRAV